MLMLTDSAVRKLKEFLGVTDEGRGIRIFMAGGG
jgi:Fe-S cluster assembly iron-binding protein IscA